MSTEYDAINLLLLPDTAGNRNWSQRGNHITVARRDGAVHGTLRPVRADGADDQFAGDNAIHRLLRCADGPQAGPEFRLLPQVGIGSVHHSEAQVSVPDDQQHVAAPGQADEGVAAAVRLSTAIMKKTIMARLTRAASRETIRLKSSLVESPNAKMKPPNPSVIPPA